MTHALSEEQTVERLLAFMRESFLSGDPKGELDEHTPLLEWGILNSFNTAVLISYIRSEFGTAVALEKVNAATFKDIRSISSMVCGTAGTP